MTKKAIEARSTGALSNWIVTISILFMSFSGVTIALICIYSLPDRTVRPLEGGLYFIGSSVVIIGLLFFRWRKDKALENKTLNNSRTEISKIVVMESGSEKVLKWLVTIFSFYCAIMGVCIALICIYALPDKTVQPLSGALYALSCMIVLGCFIFTVWKNWISE
ncbi:MAG: hypothetical protein GY859_30930 [Desulfobacterales bacterium]|nr:hypothetical protein [Desulfobacterales bacterium]